MERYHALLELAPRDVVARAIVSEMTRTGSPHVLLDLTHRGEDFIRERFPRIYETCLRYGVNIGTDAAPVAPGGALRDGRRAHGSAKAAPMWRACLRRARRRAPGVHGANRLASNSLLEGVVFGIRAGRAMREAKATDARSVRAKRSAWQCAAPSLGSQRDPADRVGEVRDRPLGGRADGEACEQLEALRRNRPRSAAFGRLRCLIARCALAREESRGAHFRTDYPRNSDAFARHSVISSKRMYVSVASQPLCG